MDIIYGKNNLEEAMLRQINDLFLMNYKNYHYTKLTNIEGIHRLLSDETFNCLCICQESRVIGFAGFYEATRDSSSVKLYKLAHLLVDANNRGRGLGTLIEDRRLFMVNKLQGSKVIYASCVENPRNSIYMKLNRGFFVNGFKYRYRNTDMKRGNSLILVNSDAVPNAKRVDINVVNPINPMTRRLIAKGNPNVKLVNNNYAYSNRLDTTSFSKDVTNFQEIRNIWGQYKTSVTNDKSLGRSKIRVEAVDLSVRNTIIPETDILDLIPDIGSEDYASVIVSPNVDEFSRLDNYLIQNKFYPVAYIPYINDYYGELEYQYLSEGVNKILEDESVSDEGKQFISEIAQINNKALNED